MLDLATEGEDHEDEDTNNTTYVCYFDNIVVLIVIYIYIYTHNAFYCETTLSA
jgi:hypothetical protein